MKTSLKKKFTKLPFAQEFYYFFKRLKHGSLKGLAAEDLFTRYHRENFWNDHESVSGSGSNTANTSKLIDELRPMFDQLGVRSLLDIPCGDYQWMSRVPLEGIHYTGGDVVKDLTDQLEEQHGDNSVEFRHLNLLEDKLPCADLIFCRDCLVHFSCADIRRALKTIKDSGAMYLATTHFPETKKNFDIVTGDWRRLNFTRPPFNWPTPDHSITEGSIEGDGKYADKTISVWKIDRLALD